MAAVPDPLKDVPERLRDAAYVAVGFAVLGFQRAQVRRRELERAVRETVRAAAAQRPEPPPTGRG